jgi:hypothetical protein
MRKNKTMNALEPYKQVLSLKKRQIMDRYKFDKKIQFNLLKKRVYKRFDSKKIITNLKNKVGVIHTKIGKKLSIKNGEIK